MATLPTNVCICLSNANDSLVYPDDDLDESDPDDPTSYKDAMSRPDKDEWIAAVKDELNSIKELEVYKLVDRSEAAGRRVLKGKFVFHIKRNKVGAIERYKVRFIAGGDRAVPGIDFDKTMSPMM